LDFNAFIDNAFLSCLSFRNNDQLSSIYHLKFLIPSTTTVNGTTYASPNVQKTRLVLIYQNCNKKTKKTVQSCNIKLVFA